MKEKHETTILQEGLVRITDRRTLIGTEAYSMAEIRSVTVTKRGKTYRPIWLGAVGMLLILWSAFEQTGYFAEFFTWGVVLVLLALALAFVEKPSYVLQIRSGSGFRDILGSTDLPFIQRVAQAINQALSGRGETV